jgi:transposase
MTSNTMQQYVGLDVHKKFIQGCILDENGKVVLEQKFKSEPHSMDMFLLNVSKDSKIVLESCSCWQYVYDYLDDAEYKDLHLANPLRVRLIAESRKKTDKVDAKALANLLRVNLLPESYAPPLSVRYERQITRHRLSIVRLRSDVKRKIHALLLRHGIEYEFSDVFGKAGIKYLYSLDLPECDRFELDNYVKTIEFLTERVNETQERVEEYANHSPQSRLLMTIPGIDYYSALMISAEIGDIRRFNTAKKLISYAGLNPSISQSGEKCYTGHIAKQGNNNLRWILGQCANVAVMNDSRLALFYQRIKKCKRHNIAITATARKILTIIYAMLKNNTKYAPLKKCKAS